MTKSTFKHSKWQICSVWVLLSSFQISLEAMENDSGNWDYKTGQPTLRRSCCQVMYPSYFESCLNKVSALPLYSGSAYDLVRNIFYIRFDSESCILVFL